MITVEEIRAGNLAVADIKFEPGLTSLNCSPESIQLGCSAVSLVNVPVLKVNRPGITAGAPGTRNRFSFCDLTAESNGE